MKRLAFVLNVGLLLALLLAIPAAAITFGQPDGQLHPNVGMLVAEFPDGNLYGVCSGTLIAPNVFLTASHCMSWFADAGITLDDVSVTFDTVGDENAKLHPGKGVLHPLYPGPRSNSYDVAVVLLDAAVYDIIPAKLPAAYQLDAMKDAKTLKNQRFVAVGYGMLRDDKTGGPHSLTDTNVRHYAEQSVNSLQPYWIQLSMNPSTGSGGTCYGDSGGPHFIGDSDVVASITVTGDRFCRATDVTYRMDTDSARDFLGQYVSLP